MATDWFLPEQESEAPVMTNIHAMVDIETFGVNPGAPVISIGATLFDPAKQDSVDALMARSTLIRVTPADAIKYSDGVDGDTLAWWLSQDDAAIKALIGPDAVGMKVALMRFRQFCIDRNPRLDDEFFPGHCQLPQACIVWANSPNFDCTILEDKYRRVFDLSVEQQFPIKFWLYRDVRTLKDIAWPGGPDDVPKFDVGVKHDARADSVSQVLAVQAAYKQLGLADAVYGAF